MNTAANYKSYVGPEGLYDVIGAAQFALLYAFGLRSSHRVLDFGCGSLRAGKLLIPYLDAGNYCGIEPNAWLIEACVREELGEELLHKKQPRFAHNDDFCCTVFGQSFDRIVAQSIFTHTGSDLYSRCLGSMKQALAPKGLVLATFFVDSQGDSAQGWFYTREKPCIYFTHEAVTTIAAQQGLCAAALPWYHPRGQSWYVFAHSAADLPPAPVLAGMLGQSLYTDPQALEA